MLNIAVLGAGRMAHEILQVIDEVDRCQACSVWVHDADKISAFRDSCKSTDLLISDDLAAVLAVADVAIDFTLAAANSSVIDKVLAAGIPLVCGVSGLDEVRMQALKAAATRIPLLYDRNMSYGMAVMTRLLREAGAALGREFKTEIHELHHRHKKDAPSGTALLLGETLADSRGQKFEDVYYFEPNGGKSESEDAIHFFVTREGETPGDHRVTFQSSSETIEFSHSVADRRVFAEGAVRGALWIADRSAGLYRMSDVLAE